MTKYLIITLILVAITLYWKYHHRPEIPKQTKSTQTDANSFSDSLGNDYTIEERPILSHKEKRKLKKQNKDD